MENLTKTQEEIINSIVNEFSKINKEKTTPTALLDVNEIIKEREEKNAKLIELKEKEKSYRKILKELISNDFLKVKKELKKLNLRITKGDNKITIDVLNNGYDFDTDYCIRLRYGCIYEKDEFSGYMYNVIGVEIEVYHTPNKATSYNNLEDLFKSELFLRDIKKTYEYSLR